MLWLVRRADELHQLHRPETAGQVNQAVLSTNTPARELLAAHGFTEERYFVSMERSFDHRLPRFPLPASHRMIDFDPALDAALRTTHIEAFQDHWAAWPIDEERWRLWFTGSSAFRGDLSRRVLDGDKIVSYVLGYEYAADTKATGVREIHIALVGTVRSHRGRGLARAALADVMIHAEHMGYQRAALGVDTQNPTGALRLYEGLGFTKKRELISYALPLR